MKCPACRSSIAGPSREGRGDVILRSPRYLRLRNDGRIYIACPKCRSELELHAGKLVLRQGHAAATQN